MKKKHTYLIIILLIVTACAAFGRIAGNDFINYDDNKYITENNHIKSGLNPESIKWAFSSVELFYWQPLTWFSHMLDWSFFKEQAGGHHLISLLLHIASVLLLFFFLYRTTKNIWHSTFAAALFALHPLRVESVAWAAERKDVLSMFFGLASIYAYALYSESSKLSKYLLCLIFFTLALMSKPMMVTLPFVLLLLDYWPLGRWQKELDKPTNQFYLAGKLIWEKIPFILLTIASSILTFHGQNKAGAVSSMETLPFLKRSMNAIVSYIAYLEKIFWPVDLAVFYPYENIQPLWKVLISGLILILITIIVIHYIKKLPFLFVGWFWYLGTLLPLIGLIQVGSQAMADRHTYLPSIGIAIILSWGIPLLFQRGGLSKKILFPVAIAALCLLTILTFRQCGYWKNSATLFSQALQVTKDNYIAHCYLGNALFIVGKTDEAIDHYNKAIRITTGYTETYLNRGTAYYKLGQYQKALEDYNAAIRLNPDYADSYNNRGIVFFKLGQHQEAIEDFSQAISLNPAFVDAYNNRVAVYAQRGQYELAINDLNKAITLNPDFLKSYVNIAAIYGKFNQYNNVIKNLTEAIRLQPDNALFYYNRGFAYAKIGQYQSAINDFDEAIRRKEDYADAYNTRAAVYLNQSNIVWGCRDANKACELGNCALLQSAAAKGLCR